VEVAVPYVAIINVPGYLPMDDEPSIFDTPGDAWSYLADERREGEDTDDDALSYSETVDTLDAWASANHGPAVHYAGTPGYEGDHDLGIAYSVAEANSEGELLP
jgi:hypothetical protein